jgi:hypothetical protein
MYWQDILLDRKVLDTEISAAFCRVFSISPPYVSIIEDITNTNLDGQIKVAIERMSAKGDFPLRLAIYLYDTRLEQLDNLTIVGQLCGMLHCKCLVNGSSPNPYLMLLVRGVGIYQPVYVDADRLNDGDEFVVSRYLQNG